METMKPNKEDPDFFDWDDLRQRVVALETLVNPDRGDNVRQEIDELREKIDELDETTTLLKKYAKVFVEELSVFLRDSGWGPDEIPIWRRIGE